MLTRGCRLERWPVLLLREADRRLEVSFGAATADALSERLTSKDAVPVTLYPQINSQELVSYATK